MIHGEVVISENGFGRPTRANLVGYFGDSGVRANDLFGVSRNELGLNPIQETPFETSTGEAVFALCNPHARAVSHASAQDGSFVALVGNAYGIPDTSTLLNLWLAEGMGAFSNLDFHGFVAAWNAASAELVLVRDRFGVESGYYAMTQHGLVFSDDQEALVRMGADRTVDAAAIDAFMAAEHFPSPLTPYKAIKKVAPGGYVHLAGGGMKVSTWADYLPVEPVSPEYAVEQMRLVVETSLSRMWPEEGDVGLLLSGGIDSAMVAVGITRFLEQPLRAFTFRYEGYEGHLNESGAARIVTDHLGIPHEEIPIKPHQMLDDLDAAVAKYGEPFNWGLHSYRLEPIAQRGIRTVFSGSGADGTDVAKRHKAAVRFSTLPSPVRSLVRVAVRAARPLGLSRQEKAEWVARRVDGLGDLFSEDSDLRRVGRQTLYRDPGLAESGGRLLRSVYDDAAAGLPPEDLLSLAVMDKRFTAAEGGGVWNRVFTRGNGMEGRYPFKDAAYVALGMGAIGANGKDILRQLALPYLPEEAANAPKVPQEMPVDHWIRGPLADPVRERLSDLPSAMTEIFDPVGVRSFVDRHVAGSQDNGWKIISLLTLESWFRQQSD